MYKIDWHEVDVTNTNEITSTISYYYPEIEFTRTEGDKDRWDVDWVTTTTEGTKIECSGEAKLRKGTKMKQYPNAYLNSGKWRWLMENKKHPYALIGYDDGVIMYRLKALPKFEILEDVIALSKRYTELPECKYNGYICPENKWCKWEYVWNPAKGRKEWELNVKLPIWDRDEYKGITMLNNVKQ